MVGAGPGDPGLLTVRARDLIMSCDCLVHDNLINPDIIALAPVGAERIPMGKRGHLPSARQEDINRVLIERAQAGRRVVRLKGGDPFVFGRGGEEALVLAEAGVPFTVVPGVTSGVAVPAYAGIPVTDRVLAGHVAFVTAYRRDGEPIDWSALARLDTVVIFMGAKGLEDHCQRLIAGGKSPATPACVIENGTYAQQRVIEGTLSNLATIVAESHLETPALVVVGEVVRLRHQLKWFGHDARGPKK